MSRITLKQRRFERIRFRSWKASTPRTYLRDLAIEGPHPIEKKLRPMLYPGAYFDVSQLKSDVVFCRASFTAMTELVEQIGELLDRGQGLRP